MAFLVTGDRLEFNLWSDLRRTGHWSLIRVLKILTEEETTKDKEGPYQVDGDVAAGIVDSGCL